MPNNVMYKSMPINLRVVGLFLIIALITITVIYHNTTNIFWLCNISTLLVGVALIFGMPQIVLVGATFIILGLVCWLLNAIVNNTFGDIVSYVSHFSFASIAVYLFLRIPVKSNLWLKCFCWYILTQIFSRLFTPPEENINLAFSIWPGWGILFNNFFYFWCFITSGTLAFLFVMNKIIFNLQKNRSFPK